MPALGALCGRQTVSLQPLGERQLEELRLLHTIGRCSDFEIFFEFRWNSKIERHHSAELRLLDIAAGFIERRWFSLGGPQWGRN
jgi:hypothetical protein